MMVCCSRGLIYCHHGWAWEHTGRHGPGDGTESSNLDLQARGSGLRQEAAS